MVKSILLGIISSFVIIILLIVTFKIISISEKSLTYDDLDLVLDNVIESGITSKSIDKDDPLLKKRQIVIASSINENLASSVISKLLYLDNISNDSIYIIISTNGGWGGCSRQITETFNLIKSPVNTIAVGACFSAGSIISIAATGKRYATKNTTFMVHANLSNAKKINHYNHWYENMWKERADLPSKWFPMTNDKEYYFNVEEAIQYKVIDEVIDKLR